MKQLLLPLTLFISFCLNAQLKGDENTNHMIARNTKLHYELDYANKSIAKANDGYNQSSSKIPKGQSDKEEEKPKCYFKDIVWNNNLPCCHHDIINNSDLKRRNAVLLIDCSPHAQSKSELYRKGRFRVRKARHLHRNDYLKVYLFNINKYKYDVEINDIQEDYAYGKGAIIPQDTEAVTGNQSFMNEIAIRRQNIDSFIKAKISDYSSAVDSMKLFIEFVKNQSIPSSEQLERNKQYVECILRNAGLKSTQEVENLYKELDDEYKPETKETYENAKLFSKTLYELRALSYTIEGTILPIQIKSYDQLKLTITLKNKSGDVIGKARDYLYQIIGGVKVDQSFGIAGHGLFDQEFTLRDKIFKDTAFALRSNGTRIQVMNADSSLRDSIASVSDITKKEILNSSSSSTISLGLTTLTHFYYRTGFFNFGPHIGISADIYPEENIRYLAGASLMVTDGRHRISLDFGLAFGKVKVLDPAYELGDFIAGTSTTAPLIERSQRSCFLGISYNIPLVKTGNQLDSE